MGYYVNPRNMSKEDWLVAHGTPTSVAKCTITEEQLPVCLVDNGAFTAAGIAFNERELEAFQYPDGRFKVWYMVPRALLKTVSDL